MEANNDPWYAIRVRSNCEIVAAANLQAKGYEEFLPLYRSLRTWSDRNKALSLPLFPGYLFCRLGMNGRFMPILTTPGVVDFVRVGRVPAPVPEEQIETVKTVLASGLTVQPWPFLRAGDRVYCKGGPLAGLEGNVVSESKTHRLIVSLTLLHRSLSVEIDSEWVRPVPQCSGFPTMQKPLSA